MDYYNFATRFIDPPKTTPIFQRYNLSNLDSDFDMCQSCFEENYCALENLKKVIVVLKLSRHVKASVKWDNFFAKMRNFLQVQKKKLLN